MDKRIGAQYFTIRAQCQTLEDFDASCRKVSDIGYQLVQLSGIGDFSGSDIKTVLDRYNLQVVCTHRPAPKYLEELDNEILFHKTIGAPVCGLGSMPGFNAKPETIESFVTSFKPVAEKLGQAGLIFAYHNHAFEFEKVNGKYVFDIITDKMEVENFQFILDVYWLAYAGLNPAKFIRERKGRIACVHFKDLKIQDNKPCFAEIGQGNIDWDEIFAACEDADVKYALVEQDQCDGDPFESLKISYDFLKEKGFK